MHSLPLRAEPTRHQFQWGGKSGGKGLGDNFWPWNFQFSTIKIRNWKPEIAKYRL